MAQCMLLSVMFPCKINCLILILKIIQSLKVCGWAVTEKMIVRLTSLLLGKKTEY